MSPDTSTFRVLYGYSPDLFQMNADWGVGSDSIW
jgi:hypothetical protein